jgi:hypothetical protein
VSAHDRRQHSFAARAQYNRRRSMAYVKAVSNITLTGAKLLVEAAEAKATEMVRVSELGAPTTLHAS